MNSTQCDSPMHASEGRRLCAAGLFFLGLMGWAGIMLLGTLVIVSEVVIGL